MPLDPVIAGGFRGLQLQDPLEQYSRISQIQQAQQQNALNALKMQEYQREMETENRLRALYARPDADIRSPAFLREVYAVSPTKGAAMQKSAFEAQKEQRLADAAMEELAAKRIANARATLPAVTPETWGAWRADTIQKLPGLANVIPETYSDNAKMQLMQTADQYITSRKPMVVAPGASVYQPGATAPMFTAPAAERPYEPTELEKLTNALKAAPPGSPEAQALQARIRILTTREPKEPREAPAPLPVVDPATGQVKYVPREQAVGMTPPQFMESLTPKERQQREAKFPQATSAVKTFETTSNTLIKDLETLAKHPGLGSITGIAAGRLPGITSAGREAEALFDKIVARGGFQELQNMRQASPTGGALGNVSNQEGQQLRQAFAALDRRQDAPSVRKAITDAINQIRASQQTIKDAYDMTYEYKQGGSTQPSAAPATTRSGSTVSNW